MLDPLVDERDRCLRGEVFIALCSQNILDTSPRISPKRCVQFFIEVFAELFSKSDRHLGEEALPNGNIILGSDKLNVLEIRQIRFDRVTDEGFDLGRHLMITERG